MKEATGVTKIRFLLSWGLTTENIMTDDSENDIKLRHRTQCHNKFRGERQDMENRGGGHRDEDSLTLNQI